MTLISDLSAVCKVQVGTGGSASAEYPVISIDRRSATEGADGAAPRRLRRITVTLRCLAQAANLASIAALRSTLETTLCQTGARVRITETGGTWDLPASDGTSAGSMPGYPRVSIADDPEHIAGPVQGFSLLCETLVGTPDTGDGNLVDHDFSVEESIDYADGEKLTETGRGTVIVSPGTNAKAWILANVIAGLETRVDASDERLVYRITTKQDTTKAEYSYTINPPDDVLAGSGVTSARVIDETRETAHGGAVRTISGDATGGSAATFAASQEPTPGTGEVLVGRSISEPQVSDGRVSFRYEMVVGREDSAHFGAGKYITRWEETITPLVAGVRVAGFHGFQGAAPAPVLGPQQGWVIQQSATLEYIGAYDADAIPLAMSTSNLMATPVWRISAIGAGRWRVSLDATFYFSTEPTIPEPHQLPAL